ncbi:MAG: SapC family protein [Burkholderiales bacterium]
MTADDNVTISPPFGYREIVPLQKTDRVLMPGGSTPEFCKATNTLAISSGEFVTVARDYPIAFARGEDNSYAPVALLGLAEGQNLFVDESGAWTPEHYLPAYIRRFPFCLARVVTDGKTRTDRIVCVEKSYLDAGGIALYDDAGKSTTNWSAFEQLLQNYERDLELTAQMCEAFAKLDLFEAFEFKIMNGEDVALAIKGMFRIDEKRLLDLKPASHKALVTKGFMGKIYAHFFSLENFARLYQRAMAQAAEREKRQHEQIQR